jgi:uncharacterized membrane protein YgdD (TMEM256/DUF423 family)
MRTYLIIGSSFIFLGILAASLSSHAFKDLLFINASYESFMLAQNLLIFHGLASIVLGYLAHTFKIQLLNYANILTIIGIFFFATSIFIKSLTGSFPLGFLTPLGGGIMLIGWLLAPFSFMLLKKKSI